MADCIFIIVHTFVVNATPVKYNCNKEHSKTLQKLQKQEDMGNKDLETKFQLLIFNVAAIPLRYVVYILPVIILY